MDNNMPEQHSETTINGLREPDESEWLKKRLQIGSFQVDLSEKLITSATGEKINIPPIASRLLMVFLENAGQFINADDLHQLVYGAQAKEESAIRKQVTLLRKLFGDTKKDKVYIDTKLGYGYRLVAPIVEVDGHLSSPKRNKKAFRKNLISSLVLIAVLLLLNLFYFFYRADSNAGNAVQTKPLTHLKGLEINPVVSQSGRWVMFNHKPSNQENWIISIRDMNSGDLIPLTDISYSVRMPRWVNSDKQIVYAKFENNQCVFILADFFEDSRSLKEKEVLTKCNDSSRNSQAILWPDGKGIFFNRAESINEPFVIYSKDLETDNSWPIASPPPTGKGDYFFTASPSGKYLAVLRNKNWTQTEVWLYQTETWQTELVDTVDLILYGISWSFDNNQVIYRNQENKIASYNLKTKKVSVLVDSGRPILSPAILPNGTLIAAEGSFFNLDLVKIHLDSLRREVIESSSFRDFLPAVSADGSQLAWISNRSGVAQIWYKLKGEPAKAISHLANDISFSDLSFSPDGRKLGGSAGGRWFILDIDTSSLTWSDTENYYRNFQWRKNSQFAFVLKKYREQWLPYQVNIKNFEESRSSLPQDIFLFNESTFNDIAFRAGIKDKGFWVDSSNGSFFVDADDEFNQPKHWQVIEEGLLFIASSQLRLLRFGSKEAEILVEDMPGREMTAPSNGKWIVTTESSQGELNLVTFEQ